MDIDSQSGSAAGSISRSSMGNGLFAVARGCLCPRTRFASAAAVLIVFHVATGPSASLGQNTVRGTVTDTEGRPLLGANIWLTDVDQGLRIAITTDQDGQFVRSGVGTGEYRVELMLNDYEFQPTVMRIGSHAPEGRPPFEITVTPPCPGTDTSPPCAPSRLTGGADWVGGTAVEVAPNTFAFQLVRPASPDYKVGFDAFSQGRYDEAIANMERVLSGSPGDAKARFILGVSLLELGRYANALQQLLKVERSSGGLASSSALYASIAQVYVALGEQTAADRYFGKVRDLVALSGALVEAGVRAFNHGDTGTARHYFERALKANPQDPDALYSLALCLIKTDRTEEGIRHLTKLIAINPGHERAALARELLKTLAAKKEGARMRPQRGGTTGITGN